VIDRLQVSAPGAQLVVETQGEGWPVVLVHGFSGDRHLWDRTWDELARRRRVVRYDLRGHGESLQLERTPFRHAQDLAAVLDALGLEACDLVGVSMGGGIALNFTLDHPQRVRRLALVSPGIVAWEWSEDWRAAQRSIVEAAKGGDIAVARELWWMHPLFATTRDVPAAAAALRASILASSGAVWAQGDAEEPMMPDLERLGALGVPTLLLTGSADLPDFRLISDIVAGAAPDVRRIDYQGAGHMLNLERPDAFLADIEAFLA
jgi:pimeloyl-ACP methyl ester carboxylesterase